MPAAIKNSPASLRIIGGAWRGRKLAFPAIDGLRPTGDRIRETLFNWLQGELWQAHCLDAFAGSGALGFEAVSRGALSAVLLEKHPAAVQQLQQNCDLLKACTIEVKAIDALHYLAMAADRQYQVVFVDPPFALNAWNEVCGLLTSNGWLAPGAWIYVETPMDQQMTLPASWHLHRQKGAGKVIYSVYQFNNVA